MKGRKISQPHVVINGSTVTFNNCVFNCQAGVVSGAPHQQDVPGDTWPDLRLVLKRNTMFFEVGRVGLAKEENGSFFWRFFGLMLGVEVGWSLRHRGISTSIKTLHVVFSVGGRLILFDEDHVLVWFVSGCFFAVADDDEFFARNFINDDYFIVLFGYIE